MFDERTRYLEVFGVAHQFGLMLVHDESQFDSPLDVVVLGTDLALAASIAHLDLDCECTLLEIVTQFTLQMRLSDICRPTKRHTHQHVAVSPPVHCVQHCTLLRCIHHRFK